MPAPPELFNGRRAAVEDEVDVDATGARLAAAGARAAVVERDEVGPEGVTPRLLPFISQCSRSNNVSKSLDSRRTTLSTSPSNSIILLTRPICIPELLEPLCKL